MGRSRTSRQRERILEVLKGTDTHPTADWVYHEVKKDFPSLSLGTVYRNLKILKEQGVVEELRCGSTFDRYDGNVVPHYHFVCRRCGRIWDLGAPYKNGLDKAIGSSAPFAVEGHRLEFFGVCDECGQKRPQRAS